MNKALDPPCPKVGQLVRLKHYAPGINNLWVCGLEEDEGEIEVPCGTIALVIDRHVRGDGLLHEGPVPVILVNGFRGWIFRDEWEPIEDEVR